MTRHLITRDETCGVRHALAAAVSLLAASSSSAHAQSRTPEPVESIERVERVERVEKTAPQAAEDSFGQDAEHYCKYARSVASSRARLLSVPRVQASLGTYRGRETDPGGASIRGRAMAGLEYDLFDLYRGVTLGDQAGAECRRYRAMIDLRAFMTQAQAESEGALKAQRAVLEVALPDARALEAGLAAELSTGTATLDELAIVERGLEELQQSLLRTRVALESLPLRGRPSGSLPVLLEEQLRAEDEAEHYESRLRHLEAYKLQLQGGFDHVFEGDNDTPLYAMVSFTYGLGGLFQGSADAQAKRARRAWVKGQTGSLRHQLTQALAHLRALSESEREQLELVQARIALLEERSRALVGIQEERARSYSHKLWFELVHARALEAYLVTHLKELGRALEQGSGDAEP